MTPLHPKPLDARDCPHCKAPLEVRGWYMPGMRRLSELQCRGCGREFYGDMPSGWGLYYPCLLEKESGAVHYPYRPDWYSMGLGQTYRDRAKTSSPVGFAVEEFRPLRRPVLLNVMDSLYGHSILPLLNAQYYLDKRPDLDLVVMVPKLLRWMVPEGVAQVWTVDVPLRRGNEWNDWLAGEIRRRVWESEASAPQWSLSVAFPFPHPADFNIERFTGVKPFDPDAAAVADKGHAAVSFIWRDDRTWPDPLSQRRPGLFTFKAARRLAPRAVARAYAAAQKRRVLAFAGRLKQVFPRLDFAVVGPGEPGGMPDWVKDLRTTKFSPEQERSWCRRYAESHLVLGIHGSNLILPSAHAGCMIELVPPDRWAMMGSTVAAPTTDVEGGMLRYTFLPASTPPALVARVATVLLQYMQHYHVSFSRRWTDHASAERDPLALRKRFHEVTSLPPAGTPQP